MWQWVQRMMRTLYQMTRSLFPSETLKYILGLKKLTRKAGCHIVRWLNRIIELTSVQYILIVRAGGASAGGCMFMVAGFIRGLLGARAREFRGVLNTSAPIVEAKSYERPLHALSSSLAVRRQAR